MNLFPEAIPDKKILFTGDTITQTGLPIQILAWGDKGPMGENRDSHPNH